MIRFFQFVLVVLLLSVVALLSAITTMHFAIHGAEIKVPDFKGLSVQEAIGRASDLGAEASVENHFYSAEVPAGRIVQQSPAPGAVVRLEWHIRLTESLGPQRVGIPNLIGQPERTATIELRRLGLQPGNLARMPATTGTPATVIGQDPPADASGVERPTVNLLISDAAAATAAAFVMPDFTGQPLAAATSAITHAGLKLAPARISPVPIDLSGAVPASAGPGTVLSQQPLAGSRIEASTPVELTVSP